MKGALAVFDFGKTNTKLFVFAKDGRLLDERRTKPTWIDYRGRTVLDDAALLEWVMTELASVAEIHDATNVMISAHGCAFALVRGEELLHPILDYEQEVPDRVAAKIDPQLPDFPKPSRRGCRSASPLHVTSTGCRPMSRMCLPGHGRFCVFRNTGSGV